MGMKSLLRVGYLMMVVQGLLSVFAPKKAIQSANAGLRVCFENVGDLEPRDWYVEVTKIVGVGLLVAGLTGLLVTEAENKSAEVSDDDESEDVDADDEDDDDGPVTVNIEDDE
jgi:hypothetical protein